MNEMGVDQLTGVSSHKFKQSKGEQGIEIAAHGDCFAVDASRPHRVDKGGRLVSRAGQHEHSGLEAIFLESWEQGQEMVFGTCYPGNFLDVKDFQGGSYSSPNSLHRGGLVKETKANFGSLWSRMNSII